MCLPNPDHLKDDLQVSTDVQGLKSQNPFLDHEIKPDINNNNLKNKDN